MVKRKKRKLRQTQKKKNVKAHGVPELLMSTCNDLLKSIRIQAWIIMSLKTVYFVFIS